MNTDKKKIENDRYLASAVDYLLEGGDREPALILLASEIEQLFYDQHENRIFVDIRGPRSLYQVMNSSWEENSPGYLIRNAIEAVIPPYGDYNTDTVIRVRKALVDLNQDWRSKILEAHDSKIIHNQNPYETKPIFYGKARFSSEGEKRIAIALDKRGVMYFPTSLVRVGPPGGEWDRKNRIPDFLICHNNKWGILEVDGKSTHEGRRTEDNERSRQIESHGGIAWVTGYDYVQCMRDPDGVVKEFLEILGKK
jgi:hypothetical protein